MTDITAFLDRIGYTGSDEPTIETLQALHRAYLYSVPFENLDIGLGRKIACEEDSFFRKIVGLHRGGFCYEMNGLFAAMLRQLGFRVTLLSARVPREDGTASPEFDHLALRVDMEEPWLADVGFGDSFLSPLPLQVGTEQARDGRRFCITQKGDSLQVERTEPDGLWKAQYSFTLTPRRLEDFATMCLYHQTSPESHFTQKRLCTIATPEGRITLSERKLIFTRGEGREEQLLGSDQEWHAAVKKYFGVVL